MKGEEKASDKPRREGEGERNTLDKERRDEVQAGHKGEEARVRYLQPTTERPTSGAN